MSDPDSSVLKLSNHCKDEDNEDGKDAGSRLYRQVKSGHYSLDVELVIGEDKVPIKVHKCVLTSASPVFNTMFNGQFNESQTNIVPIQDVNPQVFQQFIKFIYLGKAELTKWYHLLQGYYLSMKYFVPEFKTFCEDKLRDVLSNDSEKDFNFKLLVKCFEEADHLGPEGEQFIHELTKKAFLHNDLQSFVEGATLSDASRKFMEFFMDLEGFDESNEIIFFKVAHRWAVAEAMRQEIDPNDTKNLRSILGDLFFKIRFHLIPNDLLATEVSSSGLLDDQELCEIFRVKNGGQEGQGQKSSKKARYEKGYGPGGKIKFKPCATRDGRLDLNMLRRFTKGREVILGEVRSIDSYHCKFSMKFNKNVEILELDCNRRDAVWRGNHRTGILLKIEGVLKRRSGHHQYRGEIVRKIPVNSGVLKFEKSLKVESGRNLEFNLKTWSKCNDEEDVNELESDTVNMEDIEEIQERHRRIAESKDIKIPCLEREVDLKLRGLQDKRLTMTLSTSMATLPITSLTVRVLGDLEMSTLTDKVEHFDSLHSILLVHRMMSGQEYYDSDNDCYASDSD